MTTELTTAPGTVQFDKEIFSAQYEAGKQIVEEIRRVILAYNAAIKTNTIMDSLSSYKNISFLHDVQNQNVLMHVLKDDTILLSFGNNSHLRRLNEYLAAKGYETVSAEPALLTVRNVLNSQFSKDLEQGLSLIRAADTQRTTAVER